MTDTRQEQSIAIQLWTVRDSLDRDFDKTLSKLRDVGYQACEPAGFYGLPPTELRPRLADAGLTACSLHLPLPDLASASAVFADVQELGAPAVFPGVGPEYFTDFDAVRAIAGRFNAVAEVAAKHGVELGYHNHWWEFARLPSGEVAYERFLAELDPAVTMQVDVYWAEVAGHNAAKLVRSLGDRVHFLHLKDGPINSDGDQTSLGKGAMDFEPILSANANVRWNIVELDSFDGDIWIPVAESYAYLEEQTARADR